MLTAQEEQELVKRLVEQPTLIGPDSLREAPLGYRGYIVRVLDRASPGLDMAASASVDIPGVFRLGGPKAALEAGVWLLGTAEERNTPNASELEFICGGMKDAPDVAFKPGEYTSVPPGEGEGTQGGPQCCASNYLTGTDYSYWNGTYAALHYNNCYNFAAAYRVALANLGFAQPGLQG